MPVTLYNEQADLDCVATYLADRRLSAQRFPHAETQTGKTPDFKVYQDEHLVAYCEVKSPNDPWLDDLLAAIPPLTIVGGAASDPTFNRIARLLIKADAQFAAVNPHRAELNILAYVNHDLKSNFGDLCETLTGYFHASDGTKHPTMTHIAEGRVKEARRRIDAFLWFDGTNACMKGIILNQGDTGRTQRLCALLRLNPDAIG